MTKTWAACVLQKAAAPMPHSLRSQGRRQMTAAGWVRHVQACLSEGMRVYPPVPTLTREAERDMELGGYRIEKGTMLGVAVYSMHNSPAYWKVSI